MSHPVLPSFTRSRSRRAVSYIEIMVVSGILGLIATPLFATMLWAARALATTQDVARTRIGVEMTINQMEMDIRNAKAEAYNLGSWKRLTGTAANDAKMKLTLLDMVNGQEIVWTYTRATKKLSRTVTRTSGGVDATSVTNYDRVYPDFQLAEISRLEYGSDNVTGIPRITGIRITGRAFQSLKPNNTIWNEVDANHDGSFRNDLVGRDMFGLSYVGDDPKWQYIFNVQVAFRNS